jgi:cell division protein FtsZ
VNVASTLIQSAAHEDANIIFGAVLDETMGDDVKVTVIATGFRQGANGAREQSAAASYLTSAPRASTPAPAAPSVPRKPRFASEMEHEAAPITAARPSALVSEPAPDFFTESAPARGAEPSYEGAGRFGHEQSFPAEPSHDNGAGEDELEIPAYLRRER